VWLDQLRELSESWIHRQQLLDALDRPVDRIATGLSLITVCHPPARAIETQEPVRLGASQIDGYGFCTDMHTKDAAAPRISGVGHRHLAPPAIRFRRRR